MGSFPVQVMPELCQEGWDFSSKVSHAGGEQEPSICLARSAVSGENRQAGYIPVVFED